MVKEIGWCMALLVFGNCKILTIENSYKYSDIGTPLKISTSLLIPGNYFSAKTDSANLPALEVTLDTTKARTYYRLEIVGKSILELRNFRKEMFK
jgi:hypothetical protein